jgi:hypothetical protein
MSVVALSASPPRARSRPSWDGPTSTELNPPKRGPAELIPFPIARNVRFVAETVAAHRRYRRPGEAKKYLEKLIHSRMDDLQRLGVSFDRAIADAEALWFAVGMTESS